ncbi:MAG TPA: Ig-like domain-containing protein [Trebonia sp.]|nr:Ig-like domain-containing protein [Trebonia sp.]
MTRRGGLRRRGPPPGPPAPGPAGWAFWAGDSVTAILSLSSVRSSSLARRAGAASCGTRRRPRVRVRAAPDQRPGQAPASDYAASTSAAKSLAIARAATTTALTLARAEVYYGDESAARVSVAIRPQYAGTPSGSVTVKAGSTVVCVITLASARGTCAPPATRLPATSTKLVATYSGSVDFSASRSAARALVIAKTRVTTDLAVSATRAQYGSEQAVKLSVAVTPQYAGHLTGTVTITAGRVTVAVVALNYGKARYTLVATYSGNADYDRSTSAGRSLTVSAPPQAGVLLPAE